MRAVAELEPCGTPAALRRHQRRGEQACAECLLAGAIASQDRLRHQQEAAASVGIEVVVDGDVVTLTASMDDMRGIAAAVLDRALLHEREAEHPTQSPGIAAARRFRAIHKRLASAMRRVGVAA